MINIYSKWFAYSILSILTVLIYDLSRKYILDKKIVKVEEMIMFLSIFIGVLGLFHLLLYKRKHNMVNIKRNTLGILFLVAVSAYAFNICYMSAIGYSPDVTLPVVIISLSAIFTYLYSSFVFKASPNFNWKVLAGVCFTVLGIGMVTIYFDE